MNNQLSTAEQKTLQDRLQKYEVQHTMNIFTDMFEHCFTSCIDDFTTKALSGRENGCLQRCTMKTLATQQRLGERFAELSATKMNPNA